MLTRLTVILLLCVTSTAYSAAFDFRDAIACVQAPGGQCSAVCINAHTFVSVKHAKFERGETYAAQVHGTDITLRCTQVVALHDNPHEGVVVLIDENPESKHPHIPFGNLPAKGDAVCAMGFPAGNFAYCEGKVCAVSPCSRFVIADFRILNGASGGALLDSHDRLIGICSTRSLLRTETDVKEDENVYFPPETTWVSVDVIRAATAATD